MSASSFDPIEDAIASTSLSFVESYGSQGALGILLNMMLLFNYDTSILVSHSHRSQFSFFSFLFSSNSWLMLMVFVSILEESDVVISFLWIVIFSSSLLNSDFCASIALSNLLSIDEISLWNDSLSNFTSDMSLT